MKLSLLQIQKKLIAKQAAGADLYAIVESAIYKELHRMVELEMEDRIRILLKEPYLHGYDKVAPYLVSLNLDDDPVSDKLIEESRGESWLTFVVSCKRMDELADELRDMIVVYSEKHEKDIVYRFYDPRHLQNYLLIHEPPELNTLFEEEIEGFFMTIDREDPTLMYRYDAGGMTPVFAKESG